MTKFDVVIFDLDGVLLDSAGAIRYAYIDAGVNPPTNVLEHEGGTWLADEVGLERVDEIKARKAIVYQNLIASGAVSTLPPFTTAKMLAGSGIHVIVLTGAPAGTINAMKQWLSTNDWPFIGAFDNMKTPIKMLFMRKLLLAGKTGVYIDDQNRYIDTPPGWRFIHYTGQDADTLYEEITR